MIKKERGITLISLSIAVIIILTITGMIIYSAKDSIYIKNLTNMQNDIANLRDKVSLYYSEYGDIPAKTEYPDVSKLQSAGVLGVNDTGKFLILELENLEGLTLNYGEDYEKYKANDYTNLTDLTDIYIINENSYNIFYVEGIRVKENDETKMYYTDYTEGDTEKVDVKTLGNWHEETITEEGKEVTIVTNGVAQLKVGDYVNYDPTNGGQITTTYTSPQGTYHESSAKVQEDMSENMIEGNGYENQTFGVSTDTKGWRVLGVDNDTNEVLLISTDIVRTTNNSLFSLRGLTGYEWGIKELNDICAIYGQGKGASEARSITVDDINKITGYDPETANCFAGQPYEYGNEMTYTKNGNNITYESKNGSGTITRGSYFRYYDIKNEKWKILADGESVKLTSRAYAYYPTTLTENDSENGGEAGIAKDSKEYEMLFLNTSEGQSYYWLASNAISTDAGETEMPNFSMRWVYDEAVGGGYLCDSSGGLQSFSFGVRPIVSLNADIAILQQEGTLENPHQIQ